MIESNDSKKLQGVRHAVNTLRAKVFARHELKDVDFKYRRSDKNVHFREFSTKGKMIRGWLDYWESLKLEVNDVLALINSEASLSIPMAIRAREEEIMRAYRDEVFAINQRIEQEIYQLEIKASNLADSSKKLEKPSRSSKDSPRYISYNRLFRNSVVGEELKKVLKHKGYLNEENEWIGLVGAKSERYVLFNLLDEKGLLVNDNYTIRISSFFSEFKVTLTRNEIRHAKESGSGKRCHDEICLMLDRLVEDVNK